MAVVSKKKMKAQLVLELTSEMDAAVKKWVVADKDRAKLFGKFTWRENPDPELDTRKWSEKKLSKALLGLVRYELKLMATGVAQVHKKVQKNSETDDGAYKALVKIHARASKDMADKCSLAVEEVAGDKGDNTKALKEGKATLSDLKDISAATLFVKPFQDSCAVLKDLVQELTGIEKTMAIADDALERAEKKGDKEAEAEAERILSRAEKSADKVFAAAANRMDLVKATFDKAKKDADGALTALAKMLSGIKKNDDVNDLLKVLAADMEKNRSLIVKLESDLAAFGTDVSGICAFIKSKREESQGNGAAAFKKKLQQFGTANKGRKSSAAAVEKLVKQFAKSFATVDRDLKK
ncbi:hypothetical protein [Candidatus Halocynthiibacter alkanivorans]|jgi:hypothetical protein|uniref:hypothetical protein n=1 Tax=Candidatus Halocynthiibacter alkanivorans TaxID=2267619 RepID=UPI000DF201E2|nr:hypothetical protein [Candidatus Halocynthiibacter alkanivorans]